MKKQTRWDLSQAGEARCWGQNMDKVNSNEYRQYKIEYWNRILDKLSLGDIEQKYVLDFGCGPSGVVMAFKDASNLVCMDPLMDMYLKNYPFLHDYKARYYSGKIEDFKSDSKFDIVLGFNSLDHVDNIQIALEQLRKLVKNDSTFIFTLNCHAVPRIQRILIRWNRILDKPHPHQYTIRQYVDIIEKEGYVVKKVIDVDDETHWINEVTANPTKKRGLKSRLSPGHVFFSFIGWLLGMKRYGTSIDTGVYKHRAFLCTLKD